MYSNNGLPYINYGSEHSVTWTDKDQKMQNRLLIVVGVIFILVVLGSIFGVIH